MNKQTLVTLIKTNENRIRALGIAKLGLFGSFVRDDARETSDVDLLYRFKDDQLSLKNVMDLSRFLENLFQRNVDLVAESALTQGGVTPYILVEVEYILN